MSEQTSGVTVYKVVQDVLDYAQKSYMHNVIKSMRGLSILKKYNIDGILEYAERFWSNSWVEKGQTPWDVDVAVYVTIPYYYKPMARKILFAAGCQFKKSTSVSGDADSLVMRETWKLVGDERVSIDFEKPIQIGDEVNGCTVTLKPDSFYDYYKPPVSYFPVLDCPRKGY